jgi:hypothetical protein
MLAMHTYICLHGLVPHGHIHTHRCTTHIRTYRHAHIHTNIHKRTHTYMHACTHTCIHIHTYMDAHIHTCTHTHIPDSHHIIPSSPSLRYFLVSSNNNNNKCLQAYIRVCQARSLRMLRSMHVPDSHHMIPSSSFPSLFKLVTRSRSSTYAHTHVHAR